MKATTHLHISINSSSKRIQKLSWVPRLINLEFFMCIIFTILLIYSNSNNKMSLCLLLESAKLRLGYCVKPVWEKTPKGQNGSESIFKKGK